MKNLILFKKIVIGLWIIVGLLIILQIWGIPDWGNKVYAQIMFTLGILALVTTMIYQVLERGNKK